MSTIVSNYTIVDIDPLCPPEVIGLGTLAASTHTDLLALRDALRDALPKYLVLNGGHHVSVHRNKTSLAWYRIIES